MVAVGAAICTVLYSIWVSLHCSGGECGKYLEPGALYWDTLLRDYNTWLVVGNLGIVVAFWLCWAVLRFCYRAREPIDETADIPVEHLPELCVLGLACGSCALLALPGVRVLAISTDRIEPPSVERGLGRRFAHRWQKR